MMKKGPSQLRESKNFFSIHYISYVMMEKDEINGGVL